MALAVSTPTTGIGCLVVRRAVMVPPTATLREAASALRAANVSSALVGGPGAIFTERDLTDAWAAGATGDEAVSVMASDHPVVVAAGMPVVEAAALMLNREVRHLIVLMDDGSAGVVSLRSVMAVLLQAVKPELWLAALRVSFQAPAELWLG